VLSLDGFQFFKDQCRAPGAPKTIGAAVPRRRGLEQNGIANREARVYGRCRYLSPGRERGNRPGDLRDGRVDFARIAKYKQTTIAPRGRDRFSAARAALWPRAE
jgi:hypothetical protein